MTDTYDYIIVGGGNAGCVLANRLTVSGKHTVALIEAGEEGQSHWVDVPAGFSKLLTNPRHNWRLVSEPEKNTMNRQIAIPKGRGLGGSTLINGMIYVRGQPQDFDGWAQRGCRGWSFDDVLPYFKKIEDYDAADGPLRARGGPLPLTTVKERPEIGQAFIDAAKAAGHPENDDYNGESQDGFGYYQVNQHSGRRVSAAAAYLDPVRKRGNLAIITGAQVSRILLEGRRAAGIELRQHGQTRQLHARAEVILAAGAFHSPQLLELSGIGDGGVLRAAGIEVAHEAVGVGANYIDHYCTRMNWRVTQPVTLNELTRGLSLVKSVLQYALTHKGILTYGTGLVHGFMRTRPDIAGPDVQLFFMHASYANAAERKLDKLPGMTIGVTQLRPESRGTIHISKPDVATAPTIRPNFLSAAEDRRAMVEGMKMTREVVAQAPMNRFRGAELSPGADCQSDDDWLQFARQNGQTIYHASGTCRMGTDDGAVVDPALKVRGIDGLRVVDASIMPTIVSGNTQAAVFMIAEKGADLILQDAR
ncbi:GMC family oxidoreductase [Roseovarius pelagicus]|uniref:GMC family oxidoreductase N-terminal domain-containing protein n=1 Tax=Roseovarius pelagicus TaxID=2980108 RepID=A0ABY6D7C2_9RHOB|nr:GMC family oxidoreductase N-terminal domain-containing protein [Roseovarius pelagicus]UXX82049.1 GMC family oxidoreductase N-terminal domain-containing protein [Roseovarius pelagicus]